MRRLLCAAALHRRQLQRLAEGVAPFRGLHASSASAASATTRKASKGGGGGGGGGKSHQAHHHHDDHGDGHHSDRGHGAAAVVTVRNSWELVELREMAPWTPPPKRATVNGDGHDDNNNSNGDDGGGDGQQQQQDEEEQDAAAAAEAAAEKDAAAEEAAEEAEAAQFDNGAESAKVELHLPPLTPESPSDSSSFESSAAGALTSPWKLARDVLEHGKTYALWRSAPCEQQQEEEAKDDADAAKKEGALSLPCPLLFYLPPDSESDG